MQPACRAAALTKQPRGVGVCLAIDSYRLWSEPYLPRGAKHFCTSFLFLNKANTAGEVLFLEGRRSWCASRIAYEHWKWPTLSLSCPGTDLSAPFSGWLCFSRLLCPRGPRDAKGGVGGHQRRKCLLGPQPGAGRVNMALPRHKAS